MVERTHLITMNEATWPPRTIPKEEFPCELEEKKAANVLQTVTPIEPAILDENHYSLIQRLHRTTAWILRFTRKLRHKGDRKGLLTTNEIHEAELYWIRRVQRASFQQEIKCTQRAQKLPMESKLKDMPLSVDQEGLLRASGRLQHSNAFYSERHPIVLPKEHRYCRLIVLQEHQRLLYAGVHDTLVQLRERYWIISGRQLVRRVIKESVICQRYNSTPASEVTAPLPLDRVTKANPFEVTGIDFAGPLFVKGKPNSQKAYITLFTCAVTRAVHLELVEDMTATTFLHAFRRFISRRGIPQIIYTDNALTFKRSKKELHKLWNIIRDEEVTNQVSSFKIHWKFIVERAPWWGGFYERLVRSVKLSLKKALGCRSLTSDELYTALTEIEAVINSRPLTYVYNDIG